MPLYKIDRLLKSVIMIEKAFKSGIADIRFSIMFPAISTVYWAWQYGRQNQYLLSLGKVSALVPAKWHSIQKYDILLKTWKRVIILRTALISAL